jgi:hypothetical protein
MSFLFNNSLYATPHEIRGIVVTKLKKTLTPGTLPSDDPHNFALLLFKRHILSSAQELFRRRGPVAQPERRLH